MQIQNADLSWRTLTAAEQAVVTLTAHYSIDLNTPKNLQTFDPRASFSISTSDMTLDMQVWTLKLVPKSTRSLVDNSSAEFGPFAFTFKDVCRDLPLVGATLSQNQFNLSLYTANTITYTNPQDAPGWVGFGTSCGPWTFTLQYDSTITGSTPADTSDATIATLFVNQAPTTTAFAFTINQDDW